MRHEFRRDLVSDNRDLSIRIYHDPDATKLDGAIVTLLATEMTVYPPPGEVWTTERLKTEVLRIAAWLRVTPSVTGPIPHPGHLHPYAEIVFSDRERILANERLSAIACDVHSGHTGPENAINRVKALGEGAGLIDFLEAKKRRAK
jgi:hypothetical protein